MWDAPMSELPVLGATEEWVFANTTVNAHPIHLHLVQFQLVQRENFDALAYTTAWNAQR